MLLVEQKKILQGKTNAHCHLILTKSGSSEFQMFNKSRSPLFRSARP